MLLIVLGEILIGVHAYRAAKKNGTLPEPKPVEKRVPFVLRPLNPDATRLEKLAHWLGLEETPEDED